MKGFIVIENPGVEGLKVHNRLFVTKSCAKQWARMQGFSSYTVRPIGQEWGVRLVFAWYDLWVGLFWDRNKKRLYFFPVPMLGIMIQFSTPEQEQA